MYPNVYLLFLVVQCIQKQNNAKSVSFSQHGDTVFVEKVSLEATRYHDDDVSVIQCFVIVKAYHTNQHDVCFNSVPCKGKKTKYRLSM